MSQTSTKSGLGQAKMALVSLIVIMLTSLFPAESYAQDQGKQLFDKNCQVCHKLGGGKLVGPELVGITEIRERAWLAAFIKDSQALIESGDALAIEVFEANNKIPMQAFPNLSDAEVSSIIDYIANWEPQAGPEFTVDINKKTGFTEDEILRGERMFHGLIPFENGGTSSCFSCHYTKNTDSLNWNPSAHDLAVAFMEKDGMNMYVSMMEPTSAVMEKSHKEYKLTEQEIYNMAAYLSEFSQQETKPIKIFPTRLIVFILFGILMTLALIDLIFTKKIKFRIIHFVIIAIGLAVHFNIAMVEAQNLGRTQDYAPDQPIKFSHAVHAGDNETDCQYCHSIADYSKSAGIPSNDVCMNCHNVVLEGRNSGKFEINKIQRAIKTGKSVEWIKVHYMPDHVFFSHSQHVNAGQVECETCHGPVEEMHILKQYEDLSMGWCIDCHRDTKVNFIGNDYYSAYMRLHDQLKSGEIDSVSVEQIGGLDCMKCHY